jgi:tyrosinase
MRTDTFFDVYESLAPYMSSRRKFIRNLSMGSMLLLMMGTGGCESLIDKIKNRPIRRRVNPSSSDSMAALEIYKEAINLMKGLPNSDPRSWSNQSAIHGTVSGGFNKCPHGSWFFLPWHRAYLFYFEQICRTLTGEAKFGLPYWNWAMNNSVPSPFWEPGSALLYSPRSATSSSIANTSIVGHSNMETILDQTNFLLFASTPTSQGQLESGPHNYIHGFVGGHMGTGGSPLDPIFWTHHCMIDYCWVDWNINRDNDNTNDSAWTNHVWTDHFVDGNGNPVEASVVATLLMPFLSYQYEPSQIGAATLDAITKMNDKALRQLKSRLEKGATVRFDIKKRIPFSRGMDLSTARSITRELPLTPGELGRIFEEDIPERALVNIGFASKPQTNDFFVRVFVNRPDVSPDTGTDDPHYAGSFAFFGTDLRSEEIHDHHRPELVVDITETLRRLRERNVLPEDGPISLNFIAMPVEKERIVKDEMLVFQNLELLISELTVSDRVRRE